MRDLFWVCLIFVLSYPGSPSPQKWRFLALLLQIAIRTRRMGGPVWKQNAMKSFAKLQKNESGVTAIEYGLIAALIAVVAIPVMGGVGNQSDTT